MDWMTKSAPTPKRGSLPGVSDPPPLDPDADLRDAASVLAANGLDPVAIATAFATKPDDVTIGGITLPAWGRPSYVGGPTYVPATIAAKVLRKKLAVAFPGVKFWVKSDSFAGSSVGVYFDGSAPGAPDKKAVDRLVKSYGGADFDGSIDLKFHRYAYIDDDWNVIGAKTSGTRGSGGVYPAHDDAFAGCVLVAITAWLSTHDLKPDGAK